MSSNNAGAFVRKILVSLLLIGVGVVIGRYTATETEQYSDNNAAVINRPSLPTAETSAQQNLEQQHIAKAMHEAVSTEVVPIEKTGAVDEKPCVAPTADATPPIADVEDVTHLIDKLDSSSDQAQASSAISADDKDKLFEAWTKVVEASGEKMKSDFDTQSRNYEWAAEMENNIQKYFYYSQYSSVVSPEKIECKETVCKIAYLAGAHPLCVLVTSDIARQDWWTARNNQLSWSKPSDGDDVVCVMFAAY